MFGRVALYLMECLLQEWKRDWPLGQTALPAAVLSAAAAAVS